MILTKYVAKSCVIPALASSTKAEALRELTHLLFEKKKIPSVGQALDQILAREVTESTGIGRGIAVPHARVTGLKGLVCAVGRKRDGMDFMAIDRKPVHLIFLICYPPNEQTTYLNFVATVARLLADKNHLKAMLDAPTADALYDLLEKTSETFNETQDPYLQKLQTDPALQKMTDGHADLILLARLQLYQEMLQTARSGKSQVNKRIETIRSLVAPRVLSHYDRLMKMRPPALVPVEGDTCQGCYMRLPSKFVQQVRQDPAHIHTCMNCSRFIYVV